MDRVAVGLVERSELRGDGAAGEMAPGVDQHRSERADPGAGARVGSGFRQILESRKVAADLPLDPGFESGAKPRSATGRQAIEGPGGANRWLEQGAAWGEPGKNVSLPADGEAAGLFD